MKRFVICCAFGILALVPLTVSADDDGGVTVEEVSRAEGVPPLIPHPPRTVRGKSGDAACLACHEEGLDKAPQTPHAERRGCTQCHVQGEVKKSPARKGKR